MSKSQIQDDLKAAMKAQDAATRDALRLVLAAVMNAEKAQGQTLSDGEVAQVVAKLVKQTRGSIEEYRGLGQAETADKLAVELAIYQRYAPEELSEEAVKAIVAAAIAESGAKAPGDMGKVMKLVVPQTTGRADGALVQRLVKTLLNP